jgi:predicted anti-sigma-YlaC factor YlaD
MSCRELERLFVSGVSDADVLAHRARCPECEALGRQIASTLEIAERLQPPAWSRSLREALLEIPVRTVSCEGATRLLPLAVERELASADARRLESHLARCEACTEAAETLLGMRTLAAPEPPPWLATRLAARKPEKVSNVRRWLLNPRAAVAFAYGAAVIVMLTGFNPAELARRARTDLGPETKAVVVSAGSSLVERIGVLEEKALRQFAVLKGHASGYGRAMISMAVSRFMKSEPEPRRKESGNRDGRGAFGEKEKESEISTWRA